MLSAAMAAVVTVVGATFAATACGQPPTTDSSSWEREIRPILETACLDCHTGPGAEGSLDLQGFQTAEQVVDQRRLWKKIANRVRDRQMPPTDGPDLTDSDRGKLLRWIDQELPTIPCRHPHHAGSVTLRRLTQREYENTIRDLLGVEYVTANRFPADDAGYGFDNIGDVLSISPMLLEKYMAAAEQISWQVIDDPDQYQIDVSIAAHQFPAIPGSRLVEDSRLLTTTGTLAIPIPVSRTGNYRIVIRAWAHQAGDEPARMGVSADGQMLKQFDVQAVPDEAGTFELECHLDAAVGNLEITFLNDYYNPGAADPKQRDRNLGIGPIHIRGPLDEQPVSQQERHFLFELPGPEQTGEQAARTIIKLHGSRAWRRPLQPAEIDALLEIYRLGNRHHESFQGSMQLVIQALLVSPHFLFKVENEVASDGSARHLNDFELATAISYFLWGTMPDNRLFQRATRGELGDPHIVAEEIDRMLADPKSYHLVENFGGQWLQLRVLEQVDPDPGRFPEYRPELRAAMIRETRMLLDEVIRAGAPLSTLLNARHTWLNRSLAQHYGLPAEGLGDDVFQRVELGDSLRGGILTHASFLTLTSNPTRTSPVKRGKWVLENLLADPPPPPLPDVPQLDTQDELTGSLRQRMEQHRADPNCAVCHYKMDSIGFALENFDAIGRFRDLDPAGQSIDSTGHLPGGQEFSGPRELQAAILKQNHDAFVRCVVEKMFTFAIGRGPVATDDCVIDAISQAAIKHQQTVPQIIQAVVASEPFQYRSRPVTASSGGSRDRAPSQYPDSGNHP